MRFAARPTARVRSSISRPRRTMPTSPAARRRTTATTSSRNSSRTTSSARIRSWRRPAAQGTTSHSRQHRAGGGRPRATARSRSRGRPAPAARTSTPARRCSSKRSGRSTPSSTASRCMAVRLGWCPRDAGQVAEIRRDELGQDVYFSPGDAGRFFAAAVEARQSPALHDSRGDPLHAPAALRSFAERRTSRLGTARAMAAGDRVTGTTAEPEA